MRRVTPKLILGRILGTDAAHLRDYAFVTMLMIAPEVLANSFRLPLRQARMRTFWAMSALRGSR